MTFKEFGATEALAGFARLRACFVCSRRSRPPTGNLSVEVHRLEGVDVPVYSVERTVADLFTFRRRVRTDVVLEALKEALRERRCQREEIRRYARIDRVERVMAPYLEAFSL